MRPRLCDVGWTCEGGVYLHKSGATLEFRSEIVDDEGTVLREVSINGAPWKVNRRRFHVHLAQALRTVKRARRAA